MEVLIERAQAGTLKTFGSKGEGELRLQGRQSGERGAGCGLKHLAAESEAEGLWGQGWLACSPHRVVWCGVVWCDNEFCRTHREPVWEGAREPRGSSGAGHEPVMSLHSHP
jgi:hypothetical protein